MMIFSFNSGMFDDASVTVPTLISSEGRGGGGGTHLLRGASSHRDVGEVGYRLPML